jgi:hypothetical protein
VMDSITFVFAKWLALGKEVKAVYVAGKVVNFVVLLSLTDK